MCGLAVIFALALQHSPFTARSRHRFDLMSEQSSEDLLSCKAHDERLPVMRHSAAAQLLGCSQGCAPVQRRLPLSAIKELLEAHHIAN